MIQQKVFVLPRMPLSVAFIVARNCRQTTRCWSHCQTVFRLMPGRQHLLSLYPQGYHTFANTNTAASFHTAASFRHTTWLFQSNKWMSSTPSPSNTTIETKGGGESNVSTSTNNDENDNKDPTPPTPIVCVYESQLGSTVNRLRVFSLMTALAGLIGVPVVMALKGVVPETGSLVAAISYVMATTASTTAVNFVFRPYIYSITAIPIRQCANPKTTTMNDAEQTTTSSDAQSSDESKEDAAAPRSTTETLLKAVTRTVFLRQVEIVFDPEKDVQLHKGWRPLCNFEVKGVPLYVHPGACVNRCV